MQPGQFTIRRALASTALIAVGCFGLSMWIPGRFAGLESGAIKLVAASCAWTAFIWIGVGVGLPFNRWRAGAGIGFVVQEVPGFLEVLLSRLRCYGLSCSGMMVGYEMEAAHLRASSVDDGSNSSGGLWTRIIVRTLLW
jgi:hypothetical protein